MRADVDAVILHLNTKTLPSLPSASPSTSPSAPPSEPPTITFSPINHTNAPPSPVLSNKNDGDQADEPIKDGEKPPAEDEEDQPMEDVDKPPQSPDRDEDGSSTLATDDDEPPLETDPSTCACPASPLSFLDEVKVSNDPTEQYSLLIAGLSHSPDQFYRNHLRTWAGTTSGPKTNLRTADLLKRLGDLPTSSLEELQQFRDDNSPRAWFKTSHRTLDDRERLEPFLYYSILTHSTFTFDP